MNVLVLEHPRIPSEKHFNDIANTPLWSCLLAGYVAASIQSCDYAVELLDAKECGYDFDQTAIEIVHRSPELLCVHAVYFWEHTFALFEFLSSLRKLRFKGHINLFGFLPTLAYSVLLENISAVDSIAVGECEHTLAGLAVRLELGISWREIPGLASRDDRGIAVYLHSKRIPEPNPDVFPPPLRNFSSSGSAGILGSRGCYNHCRFCTIPAFYNNGPLWRGRAPEEIVNEIVDLKSEGITDFYFLDPNFIGPGRKGKERIRKLCCLLKPLGITFGMETRSNDLDPGLLIDLRNAGLESLLIGVESGSYRVLGELDKHGSIAVSESAIAMCRAAGLEPEVGFLMFVPDSHVEDLVENFKFLKRNALLDRLDRTVNLLSHRQIVFMGMSGYRKFKSQGRIAGAGPLGIHAEVCWADSKVGWMAEIIGYACLLVLRESGDEESSLYFKNDYGSRLCRQVNDYLVELFESCLEVVKKNDKTFDLSGMKDQIRKEFQAISA